MLLLGRAEGRMVPVTRGPVWDFASPVAVVQAAFSGAGKSLCLLFQRPNPGGGSTEVWLHAVVLVYPVQTSAGPALAPLRCPGVTEPRGLAQPHFFL